MSELILARDIEQRIFLVRGQKVMIDRDLAELYKVPTFVLNQAVKRNLDRFPDGFMFRLTKDETGELITNCDKFATIKHSPVTPLVFTEYGVAMLSSVLRSRRAVQINIQIIQTFIRIKKYSLRDREVMAKLRTLEKKVDRRFRIVFEAIRHLMEPPDASKLS